MKSTTSLVALFALTLAACGGGGDGPDSPPLVQAPAPAPVSAAPAASAPAAAPAASAPVQAPAPAPAPAPSAPVVTDGSGSVTPPINPDSPTFPVDAALRAILRNGGVWKATLTDPVVTRGDTCRFTETLRGVPAPVVTDLPLQTWRQVDYVCDSTSWSTLTFHSYLKYTPAAPTSFYSIDYAQGVGPTAQSVNTTTGSLPAVARVGESGPLLHFTTTVSGMPWDSTDVSWALEADHVADTSALLCLRTVVTGASPNLASLSHNGRECFRILPDGSATGTGEFTLDTSGVTVTFK